MAYTTMSSLLHLSGTDETSFISQTLSDVTTSAADLTSNTTLNQSQCGLVLRFPDFIPWNNPDNIISRETESIVRQLKDVVFLPILFLIGGPANLINMAVFYKQGLHIRINVCLFALSLADGLYLVNMMVLYGEQLHVQFTTKEKYGPLMRFLTNHYLLGFYGFTWVSQILSAIIASERCFCILQPLRSQTVLRTSTMTAIIVAVNVVVVGFYFVVLTRYYVICAYDPSSDSNIWIAVGGDFYHRNQKFVDFLFVYVYGLALPGVVMVVVTTTTTITAIKLRQAAAWRASTSSSASVSPREIALTRMLVYNSVFFIVCVSTIALFRFTLQFMPEMNAGRRHHNFFMAGLWVLNIFTYINATFNFVVYYTMGSRYRHTFWALFGRKSTKSKTSEKPGIATTS